MGINGTIFFFSFRTSESLLFLFFYKASEAPFKRSFLFVVPSVLAWMWVGNKRTFFKGWWLNWVGSAWVLWRDRLPTIRSQVAGTPKRCFYQPPLLDYLEICMFTLNRVFCYFWRLRRLGSAWRIEQVLLTTFWPKLKLCLRDVLISLHNRSTKFLVTFLIFLGRQIH